MIPAALVFLFSGAAYADMSVVAEPPKADITMVSDMCSVYAIKGDICGQSDLDCKFTKYAKMAEKELQDGTCASKGYIVLNGTTTYHYPVVGEIKVTEYTKPAFAKVLASCSLYAIKGDICGQSDLDCTYTKYAKMAEKELQDGTCASRGYTVLNDTTTYHYPVVGEIKVTEYTKPVLAEVSASCSLYAIKGDVCGQSDLDCKYTKHAKMAEKKLQDGTCASKGYSVLKGTTTRHYPVISNIKITEYTKPALDEASASCSLYAIKGDICGQSDLDCKYTKYAKMAEKELQDGTCASNGYSVLKGTTTKHYPVIGDIKITEYTKPALAEVMASCSLYAIKGDICGQSDLDCKYSKYAKMAEKELQDGTCASRGYTVLKDTATKHYPVVGDIKITEYTKAADDMPVEAQVFV